MAIECQIVKGQRLQPIAVSSKLAWLLTGNLSLSPPESGPGSLSLDCSYECEYEAKFLELVQDFWRSEKITVDKKSYLPDEQACEEFYQKTTRQDETGRYIASVPWKNRENLSSHHLENSHSAALRALNRLEANFAKDEKLKIAYTDFIKEYIDLGHMSLSSKFNSLSNKSQAFLPDHGVWKELVRQPNYVLCLMALLQNPVALICAWRRYKIALSANVEKMFRQIGVEQFDQPYQPIL